jgi:hypothetical protein
MTKRMAIGITHPPGRLVKGIMIRRNMAGMIKKAEPEMRTDFFNLCAAGVSPETI